MIEPLTFSESLLLGFDVCSKILVNFIPPFVLAAATYVVFKCWHWTESNQEKVNLIETMSVKDRKWQSQLINERKQRLRGK